MASVIAAGLTTGTAIAISGDTSGALVLQTNGTTTAVTISTAQVVTLAQPLPVASGGTGSTSTTYCALATNVSGTLPVANGGTGVTTSTGTGANVLGTSPTLTTPTFDSASLVTISGTAPLYMCRAWVNFLGSSGAISSSGNVTSVTRVSAGKYTVNFTTAMPNANYCTIVSGGNGPGTGQTVGQDFVAAAPGTTSVTVYCATNGVGYADPTGPGYMNVSIFR